MPDASEEIIRVKPHHFIDILTSIGGGRTTFEPHPYGHAVHTVAGAVLANPNVLLEMELGADDICQPCVHNIDGLCDDTIDTSFRPGAPASKREYNLLIDRRWCSRMDIAQGDCMTAVDFCRHLQGLTGDLREIYPEMPADGTAERQVKLEAGIDKFLKKQ